MSPTSPIHDQLLKSIRSGFKLLQEHQGYQQINVLLKLKTLDREVSAATLSNAVSGPRPVGVNTLKKVNDGIQQIVTSELGHIFDPARGEYQRPEDRSGWTPEIIPEFDERKPAPGRSLIFHEHGRLTIQDKVAFIEDARRDFIELGARLRTFTDYFYSRNEKEFAQPIRLLLQKGVNIKLYLLDPNCQEARMYFEDRALVQESEKESIEIIRRVKEKLMSIARELNAPDLPGKAELYTYKHIPYNHFFIVDGGTRHAKMLVSHYLYGVKRADCPVIEVSKQSNHELYSRYYESFLLFTKRAKRVNIE